MINLKTIWRKTLSAAYVLLALGVTTSSFANERCSFDQPVLDRGTQERWSFAYENDFFVPGGRDQDYTYGFSLSYSSPDIHKHIAFSPLKTLEQWLDISPPKASSATIEAGFYGFTPEDITQSQANHDDRPFAGLVYVSTSREHLSRANTTLTRHQITYGALGLRAVGDIQKQTHKILNGDTPAGWRHQVSKGGELTARYSLSQQRLLSGPSSRVEARSTRSLSVGYITEVAWGLSWRVGNINSAWNRFNPELSSYAESSSRVDRSRTEWFVWGGFALKARAYNAFLQGQFKDSAVTYKSSELNHLIAEGWLGLSRTFSNGWYASYGLRGHTSEVKEGGGNRSVIWGGIILSKLASF